MSANFLIPFLDHTLLDAKASEAELNLFLSMAARQPIAAVCVYAHHLPKCASLQCKKAAVVNFPNGEQTSESVVEQIKAICKTYTLDEIDYVFPWQTYLNGEEKSAISQCLEAIETCHAHAKSIKVIVESGAFADAAQLEQLCQTICDFGCDFLKTSTGFYKVGATMQAVQAMLRGMRQSTKDCGIKISGGVSTQAQAREYYALIQQRFSKPLKSNQFRIGSSRLLARLVQG